MGTDGGVGAGASSSGNIARVDSSNFEQFSRFDSANQPSHVGGVSLGTEFNRFNSGKVGSVANVGEYVNRIDSFKNGSISGNDYGRIDSTKIGSSNGISTADNSGVNKNYTLSISKTPTDL